jgi:hypothetical protein
MISHVFIEWRCVFCHAEKLDCELYDIDCIMREPLIYTTESR